MYSKYGLGVGFALLLAAGAHADSLYNIRTFQPLTSDVRVRHVGDLITVMVYENASASTSANTTAARDANVALGLQTPHHGYSAGVHATNQSDGGGKTVREGRVLAQITVAVREITASGDLLIGGEQMLEINDEHQRISVEGRVRPQDISETNVVLSTRIADAHIRYAGQGTLSDKQRPAWWQRLITLFGG